MGIRKGATRLEIENDGHCAFIYDEAHRQRLLEMNAVEVITGLDNAIDREQQLAELAKNGLLLAYELFQDDGLTVEVAVGKPLTAREKQGATWLKAQKARISLPSGRLCIESWSTQRISDEPADGKGAVVEVPPGDYVMTLQRVDPEGDGDAGGIGEVITLTPAAQLKAPRRKDPMLSWAEAAGAPPLRLPKPRVESGAFHGTLFRGSYGAQSNLTRRHIEALGLRFGMRVRFEFGDGDQEAVYLGRLPANLLSLLYGGVDDEVWQGGRPRLCACIVYDDRLRSEAVALLESDAQLAGPDDLSPLKISMVQPAVLPAFDLSHLADRSVETPALHGRTFLATRRAWAVNVGSADLAEAGMAFKEPASLVVAGQRFTIYPGLAPHDHQAVLEASAPIDTATRARVEVLKAEIDAIEEQSWDAEPDEQPLLEAHQLELKRLIEELLYPTSRRHTAPLYGWFTPFWERDGRQIMLVLPMVGETMPDGVTVGDRVVLREE